jgi:outer membrane lipoprotein-sorting protein
MKKTVFASVLMAFAVLLSLSAQDLQEILDNHFETIGQKNLLKVKTLTATGKASQMGMEFPFTMMNKRPDKLKIIIDIQGSQIIQACDGENVWAINPMSGSSEPIDVTGPDADGLKESADMDGQLWKWKEKGHQLELEVTEETEGSEAYVLKLTKKNGNIDYYYIDPDSYLILKTKSKIMMEGSEVEMESLLSNYQDVEGYIMPFTTEQKMNGQTMITILIDEVRLNEEMDDPIFSK